MDHGRERVAVHCRAETPADEPFVRRLVLDTITEEFGAASWPEALRTSVLGLQCDLRRSAARGAAGDIASQIVVADDQDVGWLLTADHDGEITIVEIMILPARRGNGLGTAAIDLVLGRAARDGKRVRLTVTRTNARAIRLYERLGFGVTSADAVQQEMAWTAKQT